LKDSAFSNFPDQNSRFEQQLEEPTPVRMAPGVAAPTQNIENNPMHSNQVIADISIFY
jgi:hypothetical protein